MGLQGNRRGTPSTCEICGTPHHSYQGHVFATNRNATNTDATNAQRATNKSKVKESAVLAVDGKDVAASERKTKNRRARQAYNAYQREYMRKRRAK